MKVALLVTKLACLLSLGGCLTVPETLADSDASVDDPGGSTEVWENAAGAAGGGITTGGVGGEAFGAGGTAGGIAGAAGDAFGVGGVGGDCVEGVAGTGGACPTGIAGIGGDPFGAGGTAGGIAGVGGDPFGTGGAGAGGGSQLGTRSSGCELLAGTDLCMGEGWMLAEGESIPACGESGAYRICTFETDACASHTVMMIQRCD